LARKTEAYKLPIGTQALILSKLYYGALSKSLEKLEIDRYYSVLFFLYDHNGSSQQTICDNLQIDKTAMVKVKVLDYLSKAGFIERKVNPEDRREHFIYLSKNGEKQTKQIVRSFKFIDEKALGELNESDSKLFIKLLTKVCDNLKELPSNDLFFNYKKTKT
jgi:MarR family transcriptional regulator, transcriptional regulator for hemolysin